MEAKQKNELALFYLAYQEFSQKINIAQFNINKNQHRILFLADYLEIPTVKSLLAIMRISKQAFNKLYRDLNARNLIDTKTLATDKRVKVLVLTTFGQEMIEKINQSQANHFDSLLAKHDDNWQLVLQDLAQSYLNDIK